MSFCEFAKILKRKNACFVSVGKMKIQRVTPDDRGRINDKIVGNARFIENFLARPFVDARRARTTAPQLRRVIRCFRVVRPFDRNFAVVFLGNLCWFYHLSQESRVESRE